MNSKIVLFVVGLLTCSSLRAADESTGARALNQLKTLAGNWEGTFEWTGARSANGAMKAMYYTTGNGSAVVENLIMENATVMTSVYHLDGADLRMTHFCGAQNQPRLKAGQIDLAKGSIDFDFVDITNLRAPDAPHVRGLEMRLIDPNHLRITFLFQSGDKESRENIVLKRVETKPS
jgi:hypothetical protein